MILATCVELHIDSKNNLCTPKFHYFHTKLLNGPPRTSKREKTTCCTAADIHNTHPCAEAA